MFEANQSRLAVEKCTQRQYGISRSMALDLLKEKSRAKYRQWVETHPQGRDGLRPQGMHLGSCKFGSSSLCK